MHIPTHRHIHTHTIGYNDKSFIFNLSKKLTESYSKIKSLKNTRVDSGLGVVVFKGQKKWSHDMRVLLSVKKELLIDYF